MKYVISTSSLYIQITKHLQQLAIGSLYKPTARRFVWSSERVFNALLFHKVLELCCSRVESIVSQNVIRNSEGIRNYVTSHGPSYRSCSFG